MGETMTEAIATAPALVDSEEATGDIAIGKPAMRLPSQHSAMTLTAPLSFVSDDDSREEEFHQYARVPFRETGSTGGYNDDEHQSRNYTEQLKDHSAKSDCDFLEDNNSERRRKTKPRRRSKTRGSDDNDSHSISSKTSESSSKSFRKNLRPDTKSKSSSLRKSTRRPLSKQHGGTDGPEGMPDHPVAAAEAAAKPVPEVIFPPQYAILPPPDPSSSALRSINLLVCTANLGNAAPDARSWNAWIPRDGRLVAKTHFPVRMNPPQPAPMPTPPAPTNRLKSPRTTKRTVVKDPGSPKRKTTKDPGSPPKRKQTKDPGSPFNRRIGKEAQRRTRSGDLGMMLLGSSSHHNPRRQPKSRKPARRSISDRDLLSSSHSLDEDDMPNNANATSRKPRRILKKRFSDDTGGTDVDGDNNGISGTLALEGGEKIPRKPRRRMKKQLSNDAEGTTVDSNNNNNNNRNDEEGINVDDKNNGNSGTLTLKIEKEGGETTPRKTRRKLKKRNFGAAAEGINIDGNDEDDNNSSSALGTEKDGYEAYLETLKDPYTYDLSSPTSTDTIWMREETTPHRKDGPIGSPLSGDQHRDRKGALPKRTRSGKKTSSHEQQQAPSRSPASNNKPKLRERKKDGGGDRQLPKRTGSGNSQKSQSRSSNGTQKSPRTLRGTVGAGDRQLPRRARSGNLHKSRSPFTNDAQKSPGSMRGTVQLDNKDARDTSEKSQRVLRSKSSTLAEMVTSGARKLVRSNSSNFGDEFAQKSPTRKTPPRTKSWNRSDTGGRGSSGKGDVKDKRDENVPPCRRIKEAKISTDGWGKFDVRYPEQSYSKSDKELGCYDIIVIGMQEATFSTSQMNKKHNEEHKTAVQARVVSPASVNGDGDDGASQSDSDNDSEGAVSIDDNISEVGSCFSMMDDDKSKVDDEDMTSALEETTDKSKKKRGKRFRNPLKKISKTAKTVNTLAGGGKDHTERPIPILPPSLTVSDDENDTIMDSIEMVSSGETDDEDFLSMEGGDIIGGKFKKWTDTDVIHHGIESNQLQGYTRALSYQFGQMRLLVYYKAGTANSSEILKSLDVLSVSYQATGKAGLANKGGIVAEIAVNKTTKLSFMTAHLEAHEGIRHYNNRNNSLQDILTETGSSKYFDASQSSHYTFAMGDLNYRTKLADVAVGSDRHIQFSHAIVDRRDWRTLNQYDELRKALVKQKCLAGFQTAYCNFPPTFKVGRQQGYAYNPTRSPSYTDRVLFKAADQLDSGTKLLLYEPVVDFTTSDHKPIRSGFSVRLNKELRWKSTAELLLASDELSVSEDNLDAIIPRTTKGSIESDRETMHLFITNIECLIDPSNYDHLRKQDKAELPNPKLLFIPDPMEAVVQVKDPSKKRRFGIGSSSKGKDGSSGSAPGDVASLKKPLSTPTSKDTMRPIWKDDHIYFALQTHTEHGRPIDLSGSQLHISLIDSKTSGSVIGSHCLNLAHLVIRSREKAAVVPKTLGRSRSSHQIDGSSSPSPQHTRLKRSGSKKSVLGGTDLRQRPAPQKRPGGGSGNEKFFTPRPGDNGSVASGHSGGASGGGSRPGKPLKRAASGSGPSQGGYQLLRKPSPALRSVTAKFDHHRTESNLPEPVRKVVEAIHNAENGSSVIFNSILADLDGKKNKRNHHGGNMDEIGLRSLRLQETLIEGGLITGHIKCDIDVWWT